jgi:hypothetical protein
VNMVVRMMGYCAAVDRQPQRCRYFVPVPDYGALACKRSACR